jgi:hypothetical protein
MTDNIICFMNIRLAKYYFHEFCFSEESSALKVFVWEVSFANCILSTHTKFTSSLFSGRMHKDTLKQY